MMSMSSNFNLPAYVLSAAVVCVVCLNAVTWKTNTALAEVARQKEDTVTRLLVDR